MSAPLSFRLVLPNASAYLFWLRLRACWEAPRTYTLLQERGEVSRPLIFGASTVDH